MNSNEYDINPADFNMRTLLDMWYDRDEEILCKTYRIRNMKVWVYGHEVVKVEENYFA
jgi:hypothetical protein